MDHSLKNIVGILAIAVIAGTGCGPEWMQNEEASRTYSLTGGSFAGKKYYFGWGAAAAGDPSMMHNEVKYDVLHTHDIFTSGAGGSYNGEKLIGAQIRGNDIKRVWGNIGEATGKEDMYVQYSSGHGFPGGLGVGLSYSEMASQVIGIRAKESIVFTMACHSGGLVDTFNRRKSEWENYQQQGRSLLVMASSTVQETSSTGPGTSSEQAGPSGSAGSAYGHALWQSLKGKSDGYIDGVKDGYVSLAEIIAHATDLTKRIGGHTPMYTGSFYPQTIMNRVPSAEYLAKIENNSQADEDDMRSASDAMDQKLAAESEAIMQKNPSLRQAAYEVPVYVALASEAAKSSIAYVSAPSDASSVFLCTDTASVDECSGSRRRSLVYVRFSGDLKIFRSDFEISLTDRRRLHVVAEDSTNKVIAAKGVELRSSEVVQEPQNDENLKIQDMRLAVPAGWKLKQDAVDGGRIIVILNKERQNVSLYVTRGQLSDMRSVFVTNGAQVIRDERKETIGQHSWQRLDSSKNLKTAARGMSGTTFVSSFKLEYNGHTYYGYASADTQEAAASAAGSILTALR